MIAILYIKYIKSVLAENDLSPTLQTIALVGFFLFFIVSVLVVVTRPKEYYKEISEVPLEKD